MKDRIRAIRRHFALTQEQFAARIGKTTGLIATVETGRCGLSDATIEVICSSFGVNEEWLRTGNGEMLSKPSIAVDKSTIGSRVKEIRTRDGLTQKEFADRIGFHKNQVYNVENRRSIPSDDFITSVALKFHVSAGWLRTGEGSMDDISDSVDERLIDWLRNHPEVTRELRIRAGLD